MKGHAMKVMGKLVFFTTLCTMQGLYAASTAMTTSAVVTAAESGTSSSSTTVSLTALATAQAAAARTLGAEAVLGASAVSAMGKENSSSLTSASTKEQFLSHKILLDGHWDVIGTINDRIIA